MFSQLVIDRLSYRYQDHFAVDSLDLSIEQGSFFGFLGPNGAGKTTTIKCIAGLFSDWTGSMSFAGAPFKPASSTSDRKLIGLVPQELAIHEELTARENLRLFGKLCGVPKGELGRRIADSLQLAGLEERADEATSQFSGGMKRRLNLAVGQIHRPQLLLLDEPTAGVDPQSRNHLFEALEQLNQLGTTILYTTHYMEEVERLCDRIAIMNQGKVVGVGTKTELAQLSGNANANLETVFLELTGRSLRDTA